MAQLTNHGTAIRFICDHLWRRLDFEIGVIQDARAERLQRSVAPIVPGASIVLACSYVERVLLDLGMPPPKRGISVLGAAREHFSLSSEWELWGEFENFFRLRHCFAHELGRVTISQRKGLQEFLQKLKNSEVLYKGMPVLPYFDLANGSIAMGIGWNDRLRITLVEFLRLLSPYGLVL